MSFRQSFISLSTRTLLAPPRGLSAIPPSRIYLATIQREMNNRDEARWQGIPLGHYRTQLLMEALHRNAGTITVAKFTQLLRFMQTYLPRCINTEVIEG